MKKIIIFFALLSFSFVSAAQTAQSTIVVPFAGGGSTTLVARMVSKYFEEHYNQTIIVENRAMGGGGHGGAQVVVNSKPDGKTLLFGTVGIHSAYRAFKNLPYDPTTALKPVIILVELPHVLVVNPKFPAQNLKEYVAIAKIKQVTFGSAGVATSTQLAGEKFKMVSGSTEMQHIPYKGSSLAMQDVIAGHIDSMFEQLPTTLQQIRAGNLRPLAVTGKRRSSELPNVPTVAELGYPGFEALAWFTLSVPAGTPDAVVLKLNKQLNEMLKDKEVQKTLSDLNLTPIGGSPKYAADWYVKETTQWDQVINFANVSADF